MGHIISSLIRDPRPFVRRFSISAAVSISSCPVRNTKISPGTVEWNRVGLIGDIRGGTLLGIVLGNENKRDISV